MRKKKMKKDEDEDEDEVEQRKCRYHNQYCFSFQSRIYEYTFYLSLLIWRGFTTHAGILCRFDDIIYSGPLAARVQ